MRAESHQRMNPIVGIVVCSDLLMKVYSKRIRDGRGWKLCDCHRGIVARGLYGQSNESSFRKAACLPLTDRVHIPATHCHASSQEMRQHVLDEGLMASRSKKMEEFKGRDGYALQGAGDRRAARPDPWARARMNDAQWTQVQLPTSRGRCIFV